MKTKDKKPAKGKNQAVLDKDEFGQTKLHRACFAGIWRNVKPLIVKNGPDLNTQDDDGNTPLHEAYQGSATPENRLKIMRMLIQNGANPDVKVWSGLGTLLGENGADLNKKDSEGNTTLHKAGSRHDIIRLLSEHGADPDLKDDEYGETVMHCACKNNNLELATLLIEIGADLNTKSDSGATPMHKACENGSLEATKLLIEQGADLNAKDDNGITPLHSACRYRRRLEIIKLLIENGAEVSAKDNMGETPLHTACANGRWKMVRLLLSRGANVHTKTTQGSTPLQVASVGNHPNVVWFLVRQYPSLILERIE